MAIDLHIHTVASADGEFSPQEIIQLAKKAQLQAIAITDHDSVQAVEEALYWGQKNGIEVIPGCEFSSGYGKKWLHVLGYFIDYHHPDIKQWCKRIETGRRENADAQIAKLREAGFYLEKDKVLENGVQPMPMSYSRAIFSDPRNDNHPLLDRYRSQKNPILNFCVDWIVTGRPYNAPQHISEVKDVICLIKQCGGVPVLAHPAVTLGMEEDALISDFLAAGLRGIEVYTTWHSEEEERHYAQFCEQKGVLRTCGSDFHGKKNKPHIRIGQVKNNSDEVVEQLKKYRKSYPVMPNGMRDGEGNRQVRDI